jgi:hypothetical protein
MQVVLQSGKVHKQTWLISDENRLQKRKSNLLFADLKFKGKCNNFKKQ